MDVFKWSYPGFNRYIEGYMKNLLLFILAIFPWISHAQYPIQTMYKGDSVVILTINQLRDINRKIDDQTKKLTEIESVSNKCAKERRSLTIENFKKDSVISYYEDTLNKTYHILKEEIDSLGVSVIARDRWVLEAATNKSFLYMERVEIKVMNFNSYRYKFNRLTRTFKLKPIGKEPKRRILPKEWRNSIKGIKKKIFDNLSDIFIDEKSLNVSNYPFQHKIKKQNGKK